MDGLFGQASLAERQVIADGAERDGAGRSGTNPSRYASGPWHDDKRKNQLLSFAVVRADDGYTVSSTPRQLLPDVGGTRAWLALDRNGGPVPARIVRPS